MSRYFFCCVAFLFSAFPNAGAQTGAVAQTDSNYVETGNPFTVHLSVPKSAGLPRDLDLSAWGDKVPEQNIVRQSEWTAGEQAYTKDLTLLFFDADTIMLPGVSIRVTGGEHLQTNPLEIVVVATPSPDDLNDMADIKDIRREETQWTDYLPWIAAIAAPVLAVLLASWLIGKAGRNRWKGVRPQTRGVAMNPVDHPHGGGEGKTSGGRHPVSPWGQKEGRTRDKTKPSQKLIVRRRRTRGSRR